MVRREIPIKPGDPSFGTRLETDAEMLARSNRELAYMRQAETLRGEVQRARWNDMHHRRVPLPESEW
jgi:hypothetical protein